MSSPYRRSAGCTIATSASRPDGANYCLPLVARRPVAALSANPRIDGVLDLEPRQPLIAQAAARAGSSRLVALGFRTRYNFSWERIFSRDRRYPERESEWRGRARKLADGERDRRKQTALYVAIGEDGSWASEPPTSPEAFDEELVRTKALVDFAGDVDRKCIFARDEYELFVEIFKAMFADLASDLENTATVESFPSGIPGVNFVKTTITVANVVPADSDEPPDGSSNE